MDKQQEEKTSKFLSFLLRHKPDAGNLILDKAGWADVDDVLVACQIDFNDLTDIVVNDDKGRYEFSSDGNKIRACQGHSIDVDLGYDEQKPPDVLYHGTARQNYDSISRRGILKGKRTHVHLSTDHDTAVKVGKRHGKPMVIEIDAKAMYEDGHKFYLSNNGVWLVDSVHTKYLKFPWQSKKTIPRRYDFTYTEIAKCGGDNENSFILKWGAKNFGFGEIAFVQNGDIVDIHAETLDKDFVRQALEYMLKNSEIVD